jgi:hypothetical protein
MGAVVQNLIMEKRYVLVAIVALKARAAKRATAQCVWQIVYIAKRMEA